jgi:hypothetical protein
VGNISSASPWIFSADQMEIAGGNGYKSVDFTQENTSFVKIGGVNSSTPYLKKTIKVPGLASPIGGECLLSSPASSLKKDLTFSKLKPIYIYFDEPELKFTFSNIYDEDQKAKIVEIGIMFTPSNYASDGISGCRLEFVLGEGSN